MTDIERKVVSLSELVAVREDLRRAGKTVVQCHGCFDIVHPGHVRYLRFARSQGDVLVVTVSGDDVVGKGVDRPYIPESLRLENLAALEPVDYVCLSHDAWAGPVLEAVRPDVYVKGKEYEHKKDPRFLMEKELVEGYGGRVIFSSGDVVFSSTFIGSRLRDRLGLDLGQVRAFCERNAIDRARMSALVERLAGKRVLVVADAILDRYVHCEATGIATDMPILSVSALRSDTYVGAGALVAAQVVGLGGKATLLSLMGQGPETAEFERGVAAAGVELLAIRSDERPVFVKTRYLVDETKLLKVDTGFSSPPSSAGTRDLIAALEGAIGGHDALVVVDFGYGLFNPEMVEALAAASSRAGKPYYVDVSSRRVSVLKFRGPRLATPTEDELRFAFADTESGLSNLASRYYEETGAEGLILTMGRRGAVLFDPPAEPGARLKSDYLPALEGTAVDPVGAGDVFLSSTVLADLGGATNAQAAYLASCVAAIHVCRLGNEPVDAATLDAYLDSRPELSG